MAATPKTKRNALNPLKEEDTKKTKPNKDERDLEKLTKEELEQEEKDADERLKEVAERQRKYGRKTLPAPAEGKIWLVALMMHDGCTFDRMVGQVDLSILNSMDSYPLDNGNDWLVALVKNHDEDIRSKLEASDYDDLGETSKTDDIIFGWFKEKGGAPHLCFENLGPDHQEVWSHPIRSEGMIQFVQMTGGDLN